MNTATLIWGMIFGSTGFAFFVYGKKKGDFIPVLSGIGLMVFPYFISNIYILVFLCIILIALPYFIKL